MRQLWRAAGRRGQAASGQGGHVIDEVGQSLTRPLYRG